MKIPSLGKVESVMLIGGVVIAGYLAYRVYTAGGDIKQTIRDELGKAGDAVKSAVSTASAALGGVGARFRALGNDGNAPQDPLDQTNAETARLSRANDTIVDSLPTTSTPQYDPLGNYTGDADVIGMADVFQQFPPAYSPDAVGATA